MTARPPKIPGIPQPTDPQFGHRVREALQTLLGQRGGTAGAAVTETRLQQALAGVKSAAQTVTQTISTADLVAMLHGSINQDMLDDELQQRIAVQAEDEEGLADKRVEDLEDQDFDGLVDRVAALEAILDANQTANTVFAGPASGGAAPADFRALVAADLPIMGASGTGHAAGAVPDPGSTPGTTRFLREDATWDTPSGGSGTVTSVAISVPTGLSVAGSPITTSGTLALTWTGGSAFEALAAGTWAGATSITTLGTIGTGTWQGAAIADSYISSAATWNAKIGGSTGSTDNRLLRSDGTGGATAQASPINVGDDGAIDGYAVSINSQTGTTYTLAASDTGKIIECSNASAITVTLPNNLPVGFGCTLMQTGAGQVTFAKASGADFKSYQDKTKTAGQYAAVTIWCWQNSGGAAAQYRIAGTMG